jgi:hypothetical protein
MKAKLTFEDTFSFCKTTKEAEIPEKNFYTLKENPEKAKPVRQFDRAAGIAYNWQLIKVETA